MLFGKSIGGLNKITVIFVVNFHWNDTEEELDKTRNVRNLTVRKRYGLHQYNALVDLFVWLTTCNRVS